MTAANTLLQRLIWPVAILLVYLGLDLLVIDATRLPAAFYFEPSIALGLLDLAWLSPRRALLIGGALLLASLVFRKVWSGWDALEFGPQLRLFVTLVAAILAWRFSTYEYNYYFDQAHLWDRLLLLVFVPLIWWRPLAVLPFLLLLGAVIWQFAEPLGFYSWAQQYMPIRLLSLFLAMFLLTAVSGKRISLDYVFLACCLVLAHYWGPGLAKWQMDWMDQGHVYNLLPSTWANGWLAFLSAEQISDLALLAARFDGLIIWLTLLVQLGAIVVMWHRRLLLLMLLVYPLFHLGIWAMSGIFFWQWILVEAALVILLAGLGARADALFERWRFVLSLVLIGGSAFWFKPVNLAWFDANLAYTTRFEATGESGQVYPVSPNFFAPYQYPFTLGNFSYLVDGPHLGIVWGSSGDAEVVEALRKARNRADVEAIEARLGENRLQVNRVVAFDKFLLRYVSNLNQGNARHVLPGWLAAPPQLWTGVPGQAWDFDEKIIKINVILVKTLFSEGRLQEIDRQFLGAVDIAPNSLNNADKTK